MLFRSRARLDRRPRRGRDGHHHWLATGRPPLIGAAIGAFIVPRTWSLLRQSVDILLEATPAHIDLLELARTMGAVAGIREVHDLHVWTLTSGNTP